MASLSKGSKKEKIVYFCKECGCESVKWVGQCPGCREWNTMIEQVVSASSKTNARALKGPETAPVTLAQIALTSEDRISTNMEELDRVLGGGIVPGSLTLVGGDPGIGKSTLLLQMCRELADNNRDVLYISGEESLKQIKMRAERLGSFTEHLKLLCETDLTIISETIKQEKPLVVIIDSIQTMFSEEASGAPGSITQVREATSILLQISKAIGVSVFIVGHVTKEGTVAGPRMLEHMVDTVLYFEGDRYASYRILRGVKNRFGSTNEIGVFEMYNAGLREVKNPSEYMLSGRPKGASGNIATCSMEGTRPILIEIQALVSSTTFPNPRRQTSGADINRVNLLIAVLEKRLGLRMGNCDAYVNVAGGLRIYEPAIDLGIAIAMASSFLNKPVDDKLMAIGEVGLSGEVRAVSMIEQRVSEAIKLGFTTIMVPAALYDRVKGIKGSKIIPVESLKDAIQIA